MRKLIIVISFMLIGCHEYEEKDSYYYDEPYYEPSYATVDVHLSANVIEVGDTITAISICNFVNSRWRSGSWQVWNGVSTNVIIDKDWTDSTEIKFNAPGHYSIAFRLEWYDADWNTQTTIAIDDVEVIEIINNG
jgi:uncharacterized protein YcfL